MLLVINRGRARLVFDRFREGTIGFHCALPELNFFGREGRICHAIVIQSLFLEIGGLETDRPLCGQRLACTRVVMEKPAGERMERVKGIEHSFLSLDFPSH